MPSKEGSIHTGLRPWSFVKAAIQVSVANQSRHADLRVRMTPFSALLAKTKGSEQTLVSFSIPVTQECQQLDHFFSSFKSLHLPLAQRT